MTGETWPKEEQRMRNGASGKVRPSASDGAVFLDLECLRLADPATARTPQYKAVDVADCILCESLDMAQHVIGHSPAVRDQVLELAAVHAKVAVTVYAAHAQAEVIREVAIEIAGAISEAGTDIGAGIALALEQALKASTSENTDND